MHKHAIVKFGKNRPFGFSPNQAAAFIALRGRYLTARELRDEVFPDYAIGTVRNALTQLARRGLIAVYYRTTACRGAPANVYYVPKRRKK